MTSKNSIQVIEPYWKSGTWAFDDEAVDLEAEPFVCDAPVLIDILAENIPGARDGFRLIFSHEPFPGYQIMVDWVREEMGGNWYRLEGLDMQGWLCPALFKYFDEAPKKIYAKGEAK